MDALFIELPAFERHRKDYLSDELFHGFQQELMKNPEAGDVIEGTGGYARSASSMRDATKVNAGACGSFTTGGQVPRSSGYSPCTANTNRTTWPPTTKKP